MTLMSIETDLAASDIPASELWDIADLKEFRIKLKNWKGNVIDFQEWVRSR